MSDDLTLEVELDLPLLPEDMAQYHAYIDGGMDAYQAARQVAQDVLGGMGADVQRAEAVRT